MSIKVIKYILMKKIIIDVLKSFTREIYKYLFNYFLIFILYLYYIYQQIFETEFLETK